MFRRRTIRSGVPLTKEQFLDLLAVGASITGEYPSFSALTGQVADLRKLSVSGPDDVLANLAAQGVSQEVLDKAAPAVKAVIDGLNDLAAALSEHGDGNVCVSVHRHTFAEGLGQPDELNVSIVTGSTVAIGIPGSPSGEIDRSIEDPDW